MKTVNFNFKTFFIATIICGVLTFVTLVAAAARDEGTGGDGIIVKTLEKLFYVFRFPTHTFFFQLMNGSMFFVGLLLNCLFYGLIVERLFRLTKRKNLNYEGLYISFNKYFSRLVTRMKNLTRQNGRSKAT